MHVASFPLNFGFELDEFCGRIEAREDCSSGEVTEERDRMSGPIKIKDGC